MAESVAKLKADLGMANMKVPVRFRREPGHHLPASCLEVGLQLGGSVGDAHLTPARLRAECHHLVDLKCEHTLHAPMQTYIACYHTDIHCTNVKQVASKHNAYCAAWVCHKETAFAGLAGRRLLD